MSDNGDVKIEGDFKRLNFFTGFFTTADDWNDGEAYHLEKRRLHNRLLHSPGVMEGLDVLAGDAMTVIVRPGVALDAAGNLIYVSRDTEVTLTPPGAGEQSRTTYITLRYSEALADYDTNIEDPDYSGYTRYTERGLVDGETDADHGHVELARVRLQADATAVDNAADPDAPGPNEIDGRFRVYGGAVDSRRDNLMAAARERLERLHQYHVEGRQRQAQGLHTPGVLQLVMDELRVVAAGGLAVQVLPGAALDGNGRQLYLDQPWQLTVEPPNTPGTLYIAARYSDAFLDYLGDLDHPFSGRFTSAEVAIVDVRPDQRSWVELGRVYFAADTDTITNYPGVGDYAAGMINLGHRAFSRSAAAGPARLSPELQERIRIIMETTRENFAALARRFPSPSVDDARHAAMTIQMARDAIEDHQLAPRLGVLAAVQQDVEEELGAAYPPLGGKEAYTAYQDTVAAVLNALRDGEDNDVLLTRVDGVAEAARDLAQVVFPPPVAHAGPDQTIRTADREAIVTLDAGESEAPSGHRILRYIWDRKRN